jgi:hypothetical protein
MFAWNLSGSRFTAIVPSYAFYHNTTNQVSAPPGWGIDSWTIVENAILLVSYLPCAYAIDRWGLKMMVVGTFFVMVSSWLWVAAGTSIVGVLLARTLGSLFGPLISASLLAVSNRWFAPHERAKATAVGSLVNVLGAGAALVLSPMFATSKEQEVELTLKSCASDAVSAGTAERYRDARANGTALPCTGDDQAAFDQFCCYLPVDVPLLNWVMVALPTLAFVFSALSVRNAPPTPPAPSGGKSGAVGAAKALRILFGNQRFSKLSLADFLVSGPPLVLFAAISRAFPSQVADYAFLASAAGIVLSLPTAMVVAHYLDKTGWYWGFTMAGYLAGTVFWCVATVCFWSGTTAGAFAFMACSVLAIISYVAWQTSVYECKLEYVFDPAVTLEGWVVGTDRIIINLSGLVFLASIPPERVGGSLNMYLIGCGIMAIGLLPALWIRDKYNYKRVAFDRANKRESEPHDGAATNTHTRATELEPDEA